MKISRGTLESLEFRRDDATSKEFKRVIKLDGHPCRRFLELPTDDSYNVRSGSNSFRASTSRFNRH